jgi:uncharacterized membrane protein
MDYKKVKAIFYSLFAIDLSAGIIIGIRFGIIFGIVAATVLLTINIAVYIVILKAEGANARSKSKSNEKNETI